MGTLLNNMKMLFSVEKLSLYHDWNQASKAYQMSFLPLVLILQCTLVPFHILTTDYLDPQTRFSTLSIVSRLGAVIIFIILALLTLKYKVISPNFYYAFTFFLNAVSDAYVSTYSSPSNIVTHFLGFGVVIIAYAILTLLPVLVYTIVMLLSTIVLFIFIYFLSKIEISYALQQGGAFIIFFAVISPIVCYFRYASAKNEYMNTKEILSLNEEITSTNEKLTETVAELIEKNSIIEESINYSVRIQEAILPRKEEMQVLTQEITDFFLFYAPKDKLSGDFYDLMTKENFIYLILGDCTGHGVPAALLTLSSIFTFRKVLDEASNPLTPAEAITKMNQYFQSTLASKGIQDGFDGIVMRIDKNSCTTLLASANFPLLYTENREIKRLDVDKFPIGSDFYETKNYTNHAFEKNTELYIFSDGITTQFGRNENDEKVRKFGTKNVISILEESNELPFASKNEKVIHSLKQWQKTEPQTDDQIFIGLKL